MAANFIMSRYAKYLCVILIVALLTNLSFMPGESRAGTVVSDYMGLNGLGGNIVNETFNAGLKIAGGPVSNLAISFYDTGTELVSIFTQNYTATQKAAAWTKVGTTIVGMGAIIATIATGSATLPIIVGITAVVAIVGTIADAVKNGDKILAWLKEYIGNPLKNLLEVYKPNIYIYSEQDRSVNVKLYPYDYITQSIPLYDPEEGWKADVFAGSINGCDDYLFYEAKVPDRYLQRSKGFVIFADTRKSDMIDVLDQYGFNDKESRDFIEYWDQKLKDNVDYVFYPQGTKTINKIMPLEVSPEPESVFRLWFLIEAVENASINEMGEIETIKRKSFTLIEWGGIMSRDN